MLDRGGIHFGSLLQVKLNELSVPVDSNDAKAIRTLLMQFVSGYEPSGEVLDWVHTAIKL
jgi:hypothetical protein